MKLDFDKKYSELELNEMDAVDIYRLVLNGKHVKTFPKGFWKKPEALDNVKEVTKFLIEAILKINIEDLPNYTKQEILGENKLAGMYNCLNLDLYAVLNLTYPNRFKPWEMKYLNKDYWTEENVIKAVKWLIEEKLKWSDEDIKNKICTQTFNDNGLNGILQVYGTYTFKIVNLAYPGKFKPWELSHVCRNFWTEENMVKAIKWLIEEKLKWSDVTLRENLTIDIFTENGLTTLVNNYNGSIYNLINLAYPDKFKPWEFKRVPKGYWVEETTREAVIWLVEEELKIKDLNGIYNISNQTFIDNGLHTLVKYKDYVTLLKEVYPKLAINKFKNINYLSQHKATKMNIF